VKLKLKTSLEKPKLFQRKRKLKAPANEAKEGTEKNN
jgi:hypothetical protein